MGFVVGVVLTCEPVQGKDKLKALTVDVGAADPLAIVTNAPNVQTQSRVVVATVGTELNNGETVKKANVGGAPSEGMLCDPPMLGWVGGGAGAAATVPDTFSPGDTPPAERPRGGPAASAAAEPAVPAVDVKPLFEKKGFLGPNHFRIANSVEGPRPDRNSFPTSILDTIDKLTTTTVSLNNRTSSFEEPVDVDRGRRYSRKCDSADASRISPRRVDKVWSSQSISCRNGMK